MILRRRMRPSSHPTAHIDERAANFVRGVSTPSSRAPSFVSKFLILTSLRRAPTAASSKEEVKEGGHFRHYIGSFSELKTRLKTKTESKPILCFPLLYIRSTSNAAISESACCWCQCPRR